MDGAIAAAECRRQAEAALARGDRATAIERLRRAASLYAALDAAGADDLARAQVCRLLADLLAEADRLPEAMQAYQEAADAFGRVPGAEGEAQVCARRIVEGVKRLWQQPQERLYLLIARHEREQRQLAETPGTESAQADCAFHIATILHRRDRFSEAAQRYREALTLYERAPCTGLQQAACHHRLAGLFHYELPDHPRAAAHYEQAIRLYGAFEPLSEGEQMNRVLCEWMLRELNSLPSA